MYTLGNPLEIANMLINDYISLVLAAKVIAYCLSAFLATQALKNIANVLRNK